MQNAVEVMDVTCDLCLHVFVCDDYFVYIWFIEKVHGLSGLGYDFASLQAA